MNEEAMKMIMLMLVDDFLRKGVTTNEYSIHREDFGAFSNQPRLQKGKKVTLTFTIEDEGVLCEGEV